MAPLLIAEITKAKETAKLGVDLKLVRTEMTEETAIESQTWFLRGWNEHTSTPYWELRRTKESLIEGTFRFHLVARAVARRPASGTLMTRAVINGHSFWIIRRDSPTIQAQMRFDITSASA